jgi:hypothetical protein
LRVPKDARRDNRAGLFIGSPLPSIDALSQLDASGEFGNDTDPPLAFAAKLG